MKVSTLLILKIVISQLFFTAAACFIELCRSFIIKLVFHNINAKNYLNKYAIYIYPFVTIVCFLILEICLYILMDYLQETEINERKKEIRKEIKEAITKEDILKTLKSYIKYHEVNNDEKKV